MVWTSWNCEPTVAEPDRGPRNWLGKAAEKAAVYGNRRRIQGNRGKSLQRHRGERIEKNFVHRFDTGELGRLYVRGKENVHKKFLIQAAACNLALLMHPRSAEAENDLALELGRDPEWLAEAAAHFEKALEIHPNYPEAHFNLGVVLDEMGRVEDAIRQDREAILLRPDYAVAHVNLAVKLSRVPGGAAEASAEYRTALGLNPNLAHAHFGLAALLSDMPGQRAEAVAEYRETLRIRPDYLEAPANLGLLLAEMPGRTPEGLAEYQAALRINPASPEVHYDLAQACYGQVGERRRSHNSKPRSAPGRLSSRLRSCWQG